jgi:hypothetical protein
MLNVQIFLHASLIFIRKCNYRLNAQSNQTSNVIPYDSQELSSISFDESDNDDDAINMLFMLNENVILKDCKGITWVTYLGPQNSGEILQHKVQTRNGRNFLVDGALLSSMDAPDISTIPVSIEQYATEIPKFTQEQIQGISHPQILDNDQQEFMGLHCKMSHLPLPAMITLADNSTENSLSSNTDFQFACLASLAPHIVSHGIQKLLKDPFKKKRMMLLANELVSII